MLWSGAVGALVAALIGGLVALGVVRMTNRNQARLAAEAREKTAIADFIAGADLLLTEYAEGLRAIEGLIHVMGSASIRWQMELEDEEMAAELTTWPHHLAILARLAYAVEQGGKQHSPAHDKLLEAVIEVRFVALEWPRATEGTRSDFRKKLKNIRSANEKFIPRPPQ